jgi:hypothetical protein
VAQGKTSVMNTRAIRKILPSLLCFGLPLILAVVLVASHPQFFFQECDRFGDYPVIALDAARAARGEALLGPYSRHGFNHPGPANLYWNAFVSKAFASVAYEYGRYSLAQLVLHLLFLSAALSAVCRFKGAGGVLFFFATSVAVLSSAPGVSLLADIWGPATLPCAMFAFIVCAAAIAEGAMRYSFPWAVSIAILLSNHVGTWPVVLPLALAVVVVGGLRFRRATCPLSRIDSCALVGALITLVAASLPPFVEAVRSPGFGNIGKILVFLRERTGAQEWSEVVRYLSSFFSLTLGSISLSAGLVGLCITPFILYAYRRCGGFVRAVIVVSLVVLLLALPGALNVRGRLHPFIFSYLYAVAAVLMSCAMLGLQAVVAGVFDTKSGGRLGLLTGGVLTGLVLYYVGRTPLISSCVSQGLYDRILDTLNPQVGSLYILDSRKGHISWEHYAQMAYAFSKRGVDFCALQRWEFMYGLDRSCRRLQREGEWSGGVHTLSLVARQYVTATTGAHTFDAGPFFVVDSVGQ